MRPRCNQKDVWIFSLSKRGIIMNGWALYKAEGVAENAVEAAGGLLVWWETSSRRYPHTTTLRV